MPDTPERPGARSDFT